MSDLNTVISNLLYTIIFPFKIHLFQLNKIFHQNNQFITKINNFVSNKSKINSTLHQIKKIFPQNKKLP